MWDLERLRRALSRRARQIYSQMRKNLTGRRGAVDSELFATRTTAPFAFVDRMGRIMLNESCAPETEQIQRQGDGLAQPDRRWSESPSSNDSGQDPDERGDRYATETTVT